MSQAPDAPQFKTGRKPNSGKPRIRLTVSEVPGAAVTPPSSVDYYSKVPSDSWRMDGNDTVGDCTCAEVDHAVKALQIAAGNAEVQSTDAEVLAAYSAITGYTPSDPRTDQGAEMQDVRSYWQKTGFTLGGSDDQILLFAEVDTADPDLTKWCVDRFGEVGLGIRFPESAMTQFNDNQPWDVVPGAKIEGGHAIALVGYDETYYYIVTWGRVQPMTPAFFEKYVDEAWISFSQDFVNRSSGNDPFAETLYQLGQQFTSVTGKPNPVPAPQPAS